MSVLDNQSNNLEIVGVGNAIVDLLSVSTEEFIINNKLSKSTMHLTSREDQENLLSQISDFEKDCGGSVANSINTLAGLGIRSGFFGRVAKDHWGQLFSESFKKTGVVSLLEFEQGETQATGTSLIMVTPDSERTMCTHLGVSDQTSPRLDFQGLSSAKLIFIEGYLLDSMVSRPAILKLVDDANASGVKIAITLSDAECVQRNREDFEYVFDRAEIVFANEKEALTFWNLDEATINENSFSQKLPLDSKRVIITLSDRGCFDIENQDVMHEPAVAPINLIDLTGAGDQFAAGYLYGYIKGLDRRTCSKLGNQLASLVISQLGPRLTKDQVLGVRNNILG